MQTPAGTECRYYYEDFYRRREPLRECRLISRNPESLSWSPDLCASCPMPQILLSNTCPHLALMATVKKRFLIQRYVHVDAYCDYKQAPVAEPRVGCGECARLKR